MSFPRSCAAAVEAQHALNYFHPLLTKEVEEQAQEKKKKKKKKSTPIRPPHNQRGNREEGGGVREKLKKNYHTLMMSYGTMTANVAYS